MYNTYRVQVEFHVRIVNLCNFNPGYIVFPFVPVLSGVRTLKTFCRSLVEYQPPKNGSLSMTLVRRQVISASKPNTLSPSQSVTDNHLLDFNKIKTTRRPVTNKPTIPFFFFEHPQSCIK